MNKVQLTINSIFLLLCAILAPKSFAEPLNLGILTQTVIHYHDSGAYTQEIADVIDKAHQYVNKRVNINNQLKDKQKLAIVLDIDETSLSNYKYMIKRHFHATREQLKAEILQEDAAVIQPALKLFNAAKKLGIDIFFVTGRYESEREPTRKNLIKAGFSDWKQIYFKPDNYNERSVIPFKTKMRKLISQQGYQIIASIGDQDSDIIGGYAEQGFKLPNPYYFLP